MTQDKIIGNLQVPITEKDLLTFESLINRIKKYELNLKYEDYERIVNYMLENEEYTHAENNYIATNEDLNKLFKELKIK